MSASSYRPLSLVVAASTKTDYLTPNSLRLYDDLDSRSSLSFQLRMPTSVFGNPVGYPVYLAAGTSNVYTTMAGIRNPTFDGELYSTTIGSDWFQGLSSCYWRKRIDGLGGSAYLTTNTMKFVNVATSSNQILEGYQNLYGTYSSNAIPIEPYTDYRVSVNSSINLSALNRGYTRMVIYTGASSTMSAIATLTDTTTLVGDITLTTNFSNTTDRYMDIRLGLIYGKGTVAFSGLTLEKITPPYIFGGIVDNFKATVYPFTSYMQLDCNAVDFSVMVGKRVAYYSYKSSGLGDYTLVNTSETFTGDGVTRAWALTYPTASSVDPTITLNGLACDTTAFGGTSTHGYYYTPSSNFILGNTSNSAPATTDSLKVVYKAQVGTTMYASDIIKHINETFLDGEVIDAETCVETGPAISELNANYTPVDNVFNSISNMTGYSWYVDPWRRIHYFSSTNASTAPFDITSTSNNWRDLTVSQGLGQYRTRQHILGSYASVVTTESFKGDGYTRTWTLSKPVQDTPMVKVDGYTVSLGVAGVATSTQAAYWNKATNQVFTNSTNSALASTDWITVQYNGLVPGVATVESSFAISVNAGRESGSGIREVVEQTPNRLFTNAATISYANAVLERYGGLPRTITFETDMDGLAPGMIISFDLPQHAIEAAFGLHQITSISARDVDRRTMRYKVTAMSGYNPQWIKYFKSLLTEKSVSNGVPYENLTLMASTT